MATSLLLMGLSLTCRHPYRPPTSGAPGALDGGPPGGAFVAGTFKKFMSVGQHLQMAKDDETRLYVGRFDGEGTIGWLRSFPGASDSVAVAYTSSKSGIVVAGAFRKAMDFDRKGQELRTDREAGLFFASFEGRGRALASLKLAEADGFRAPTLAREGSGYRISTTYRGRISIPGIETPAQPDGTASLLVDENGKLVRASVKPEQRLQTPPGGVRGQLDPGGDGLFHGQTQLAMMQLATCDYCAPNNAPWSGSPCARCRDIVFGRMPWCRDTAWSIDCMREAVNVCNPLNASFPDVKNVCYCTHGVCNTGNAMLHVCQAPPGAQPARASCVNQICGIDSFCCTFDSSGSVSSGYYPGWDQQCVNESAAAFPSCP